MGFDEAAGAIAARVRSTGRGYLTMRRDELRDVFEIGRFTAGQSEAVCEALKRHGVFTYPHPFESGPTLRLYDQAHPVAGVAEAVVRPDVIPETELRRAAEVFARERAGRDLRSDDAPWLAAFDLFLQVVLGRDPDGWEELRDDRHPSELARELGAALGLAHGIADQPSTLRIAAAVCAFRSRRRHWPVADLLGSTGDHAAVSALIDSLGAANRRLHEEHDRLLRQAARLLGGTDVIPERAVELGVLQLRYRREELERGDAK